MYVLCPANEPRLQDHKTGRRWRRGGYLFLGCFSWHIMQRCGIVSLVTQQLCSEVCLPWRRGNTDTAVSLRDGCKMEMVESSLVIVQLSPWVWTEMGDGILHIVRNLFHMFVSQESCTGMIQSSLTLSHPLGFSFAF